MAFLAQHTLLLEYLQQVGPIFLLLALALGIVGLPIPDESLLVSAGYLAAHQKISPSFTLIAACMGSIVGITISYLLGRLIGHWIIKKYGTTFNLTPENLAKVKLWFAKIGKWTLVIGYFIPILRHLVGFVAGGARLDYKQFAFYAYSGAILWSLTFYSIGYYSPVFLKFLFHKS
jgi:membrane protein DedA with SNARE-associated domain